MKRLHVGVDLDDVVLNFCGGLVTSVNLETGSNLRLDDINQWDLHQILDPLLGQSFWTWLREKEWIWATFPAIPGAMKGLDDLRRQGHYLELVTSKPEWAEHNVWKWLGKWRPPFQRVTIVGAEDKKRDFTDADVLVDDKPENLREFVPGQSILFDRPHNQKARGLTRAKDWAQVVFLIEGMSR